MKASAVAVIPARGGSKRIPGKNIKLFDGKPIIAYSIETAKRSKLFSAIYVSTESDEVAEVAMQYGAKLIRRPMELADDITGTQEVMRHAAEQIPRTNFLCCIYPTSPMMTTHDLRRGFDAVGDFDVEFAFSVGTNPLADAGQFYWGTYRAFLDGRDLYTVRSRIIPIHPKHVCDINTPEDWARAEQMYALLKS